MTTTSMGHCWQKVFLLFVFEDRRFLSITKRSLALLPIMFLMGFIAAVLAFKRASSQSTVSSLKAC